MHRLGISLLCCLVGLLFHIPAARAGGSPVSAVWDVHQSELPAVERMIRLVDDILDTVAREHVACLNRSDLERRWLDLVVRQLALRHPNATAANGRRSGSPSPADHVGFWPPASALLPENPGSAADGVRQMALIDMPAVFEDKVVASLEQLLSSLPGSCRLSRTADARVNAQLAANAYVGLGVAAARKDGYLEFATIFPGGTAARAGFEPGTIVMEVDGWNTLNQELSEVIDRLRGPQGSLVSLRIKDSRGERTLTVQRDVVRLPTVRPWGDTVGEFGGVAKVESLAAPLAPEIAYLNCTRLGSSTIHELRLAAARIRQLGFRAVILDLRHARSDQAITATQQVADALTDGERLWLEGDREGFIHEQRSDRECLFRGLPLYVVMTSSSGPAEMVLAGALQGTNHTVIVEEQVHLVSEDGEPGTASNGRPSRRTEEYRTDTFPAADGGWTLELPVRQILRPRHASRWPVRGDYVWHSVRVAPTEKADPRYHAERQARLAQRGQEIRGLNPTLPQELQQHGALGLTIALALQELRRTASHEN